MTHIFRASGPSAAAVDDAFVGYIQSEEYQIKPEYFNDLDLRNVYREQ